MNVKILANIVATCGYLGYSPYAPGTIASLATVIVMFFVPELSLLRQTILLLATIVVGVWSASICVQISSVKDPSYIVIDEVAGMILALMFLPKTWEAYTLAFVLFRVFDICKPFPISWVDKNLVGAGGIMADDIFAGIAAQCCICLIFWWWSIGF